MSILYVLNAPLFMFVNKDAVKRFIYMRVCMCVYYTHAPYAVYSFYITTHSSETHRYLSLIRVDVTQET